MKRLLVVGSVKSYGIESFYITHIRDFGMEVKNFPAQEMFSEYYDQSLINKIVFRLGLSSVYRNINIKLKKFVEEFRPEAIIIFKGMELYPETLAWVRGQGILLANYNPDNPFIFSGRGSGNANITNSIKYYDLHFTYNSSVQRQLSQKYKMKVAFLPFGFEIKEGLYGACCLEPEVKAVCFLGNADKKRSDFVLQLAKRGIGVAVYGAGWDKFEGIENLDVHGLIYGDAFWKVLRKYRIQLNLMRVHNEDSHNMRTFEIPAIGGIMLAPDTLEHRSFFTEGEAFFFSDLESCISKITFLMSKSDEEAAAIREAARSRSIRSGYSYRDRAQQLVREMENIL